MTYIENCQGRIQDLKWGVAHKWIGKFEAGWIVGFTSPISFEYTIIIVHSITIYFRYDFYYNPKAPYKILY